MGFLLPCMEIPRYVYNIIITIIIITLLSYYAKNGINHAYLLGQLWNKEVSTLSECQKITTDLLRITCEKTERDHRTPIIIRWFYVMTCGFIEDMIHLIQLIKDSTIWMIVVGAVIVFIAILWFGKSHPIINNYIPPKHFEDGHYIPHNHDPYKSSALDHHYS